MTRASRSMTTPRSTICIGCGRDHAPGEGCGYEREVRWAKYGRGEGFAHVRLFPVVIGLAAASVAVFFLVRPPENPIFLYVGVALPALVAVVLGGLGIRAMIGELRKRRYRVSSVDGRDRALVVFVGDELRYAFGETLKYEPVLDLEFARPLSSAAAHALGEELADLLDADLVAWVRRDSRDETLLRDPSSPDSRLAMLVAMAVLGLAGRGQIALFLGRYKAWGRGGGKMPRTTRGIEVALDAVSSSDDVEGRPLEERLLSLAGPGDASPTALDAMIDAIADGRDARSQLTAFESLKAEEELDLDAAREAWQRAQTEEGALVMRLLQHVLPERPRTIGGEPREADADG